MSIVNRRADDAVEHKADTDRDISYTVFRGRPKYRCRYCQRPVQKRGFPRRWVHVMVTVYEG